MFIIKTTHDFDAAHFLKGYEGKCSNIHGHRWKVEISVGREELDTEGNTRGMVVDFSTLKQDVKDTLEYFDHKLIVEEGTLKAKTIEALEEEGFAMVTVPMRPTAENFSKYFYDLFTEKGYYVVEATVYETPNNCATYREC